MNQNLNNNKFTGPGRGFGNLNISNDIRIGSQSRDNTKMNKQINEERQSFEQNNKYENKKIIEPINRVCMTTRTQNQLFINK